MVYSSFHLIRRIQDENWITFIEYRLYPIYRRSTGQPFQTLTKALSDFPNYKGQGKNLHR